MLVCAGTAALIGVREDLPAGGAAALPRSTVGRAAGVAGVGSGTLKISLHRQASDFFLLFAMLSVKDYILFLSYHEDPDRRDDHTSIMPADILREYVEDSGREKFRGNQQNIRELISTIGWNSMITEPLSSRFTFPDPKDQMYLDAAVFSMADVIVTGNKKHFPEPENDGVRELPPREFLDLLHLE
jgi:predicted nucleic acid-binding protein